MLRQANSKVRGLDDSDCPGTNLGEVGALALVAIGMNLERIADHLASLVESTTDVMAIKEALETLARASNRL